MREWVDILLKESPWLTRPLAVSLKDLGHRVGGQGGGDG